MISNAGPEMPETQCTFIDTAIRAGVGHIVKFSGRDSIDGFDNEQFRSSRRHEQILRYLFASGTPWTVLQPSQFMHVYFEEVPDIDDIAKVAHQVLTTPGHEGEIYP